MTVHERRRAAIAVTLVLMLGACGDPASSARGSPDEPVSNTPGTDRHARGGPKVVVPRPGMEGVKAVGWNRVVVGPGGRTLRLVYVGGVAPCYVLDHVATTLDRRAVTVTLYEGSDPAHPNAVCPEVAQLKAVDIKLPVPLGARRVVDGATTAR